MQNVSTNPAYRLGATPSTPFMYELNEKYAKIADKLIKKKPALKYIYESAVSIAYLSSDVEKKKNYKLVLGDCAKVSERYKWCCPFDFMITIYEPNVVELSDEQLEILIYHELQHVGISDADGIEPSFYVVPHDIEEFWTIEKEYGLKWDETGGTKNAKRRKPKQ